MLRVSLIADRVTRCCVCGAHGRTAEGKALKGGRFPNQSLEGLPFKWAGYSLSRVACHSLTISKAFRLSQSLIRGVQTHFRHLLRHFIRFLFPCLSDINHATYDLFHSNRGNSRASPARRNFSRRNHSRFLKRPASSLLPRTP